jgi:hypothetical protein
MKRGLSDALVKEAIGRILRDQPLPGDGNLFLEALECEREVVSFKQPEPCALQGEWGRRRLAQDLIDIGAKEFIRVTTDTSLSSPGSTSGGSSISEPRTFASPIAARIASRRRGPAASYKPDA